MLTDSSGRQIVVTAREIISSLTDVGIERGQTVLMHSSLKNLGMLSGVAPGDRNGYCRAIFECFDSILGISESAGTLVVPTFTHDYVRKKKPFVLDETPSETGVFTEYIRQLPTAIRTLHPIASLAVIGKNRDQFLNLSSSAYGINSAFDRLEKILGARIIYFGANANHTTILHHLEQLIGVSYVYNKAYFSPDVYINRTKKVEHPFFSAVRYLNGKITLSYSNWKNEMVNTGAMLSVTLGDFTIMSCKVADAMSVGYEMLQRDPCALLESHYFTTE